MKTVSFYLILLFFILISCEDKKVEPEYLWSEERMVEVMTEVQLAEALVRLGYHRGADSMHLNDSVFNAAFRAVGVSRVDFDSNFFYYQRHPDQLERVFEQVINNLSARAAEVKAAQMKSNEEDKAQTQEELQPSE